MTDANKHASPSSITVAAAPKPKPEDLPDICVSLWRRLSADAVNHSRDHAGNGNNEGVVKLDERGLLHVRADRYKRTFVTELIDFCDYWINVKGRSDVLCYANPFWEWQQRRSRAKNGGSVMIRARVVVLEFPEWVTNNTELPIGISSIPCTTPCSSLCGFFDGVP